MNEKSKTGELVWRVPAGILEVIDIPLEDMSRLNRLRVDMDDVKGITSSGVRNMALWLQNLKRTHSSLAIQLENVPFVVARQICLVRSFFNDVTKIESVYVPYYCEPCDEEEQILIHSNEVRPGSADQFLLKAPLCAKCGGSTEIDVLPGEYFRLLVP